MFGTQTYDIQGQYKQDWNKFKRNKSKDRDNLSYREGMNTWTNCSFNSSLNNTEEENKAPSELFININIYQKTGDINKKIITTTDDFMQQSAKKKRYGHSRQPSNRLEKDLKRNDIQRAHVKILTQIASQIEKSINEIQTQQQPNQKNFSNDQKSQIKVLANPKQLNVEGQVEKIILPNQEQATYIKLINPTSVQMYKELPCLLKINGCEKSLFDKIMQSIMLHGVKFLNLSSCGIVQANFLGQMTQLKVLQLSQNKIQFLNYLEDLYELEEIYLADNQIIELNGFKGKTHLRIIDLRNNRISALQQLLNFQKCKTVSVVCFKGNPIAESPDYRRVLIKMFPALRGSDLDEPQVHSTYAKQISDFFENSKYYFQNDQISMLNFSFSQEN